MITINQSNVLSDYHRDDNGRQQKQQLANFAIALKASIVERCGGARNVNNILNDCAISIQRQVNQGGATTEFIQEQIDLIREGVINEDLLFGVDTITDNDIDSYLKSCVLLSKHGNHYGGSAETKINWFGIANKTQTLSNVLSGNAFRGMAVDDNILATMLEGEVAVNGLFGEITASRVSYIDTPADVHRPRSCFFRAMSSGNDSVWSSLNRGRNNNPGIRQDATYPGTQYYLNTHAPNDDLISRDIHNSNLVIFSQEELCAYNFPSNMNVVIKEDKPVMICIDTRTEVGRTLAERRVGEHEHKLSDYFNVADINPEPVNGYHASHGVHSLAEALCTERRHTPYIFNQSSRVYRGNLITDINELVRPVHQPVIMGPIHGNGRGIQRVGASIKDKLNKLFNDNKPHKATAATIAFKQGLIQNSKELKGDGLKVKYKGQEISLKMDNGVDFITYEEPSKLNNDDTWCLLKTGAYVDKTPVYSALTYESLGGIIKNGVENPIYRGAVKPDDIIVSPKELQDLFKYPFAS